jgi:hypothetical protein
MVLRDIFDRVNEQLRTYHDRGELTFAENVMFSNIMILLHAILLELEPKK